MTTVSNRAGASVYRFGDYDLDRRTLELRKAGLKIKLAPQPARVLAAGEPARQLVSRDESAARCGARERSSISSAI